MVYNHYVNWDIIFCRINEELSWHFRIHLAKTTRHWMILRKLCGLFLDTCVGWLEGLAPSLTQEYPLVRSLPLSSCQASICFFSCENTWNNVKTMPTRTMVSLSNSQAFLKFDEELWLEHIYFLPMCVFPLSIIAQ